MDLGRYPLAKDDEVYLIAALELIGRTGALSVTIGYDEDAPEDTPADAMIWYAECVYGTDKIGRYGKTSPITAAVTLARRLINGGVCTHCGRICSVATDVGPSSWRTTSFCTWRYDSEKRSYLRGCRDMVVEDDRAAPDSDRVLDAFARRSSTVRPVR